MDALFLQFESITISWRSALLFALYTSLLFIQIMLLSRDLEKSSHRYLAVLLFVFSLNLIPQIIGFSGAYQIWPGLTFAPFNNELWLGPLLYLHIHSLLTEGQLAWRKWLFVPGLVQTCYYSMAFVAFEDYRDKWAYAEAIHNPYILPVETVLTLGLGAFCFWLCFQSISSYRRFLVDHQSDAADFEPIWLNGLLISILVLLGIWFSFEVFDRVVGLSYVGAYPIHVLLSVMMIIFGLQAISRIRSGYPKMTASAQTPSVVIEPEPQSAPTEMPDWQQMGQSAEKALLDNHWYLESRLTLSQLAHRMGTNESYLSRALNQGLGVNFNQFVNEARVNAAKQKISAGESDNLLQIAYDCGFNSKASFNRLFKQIQGITPSDYRSQIIETS